ncbi:kinase-like protein [Ophiobolus disseminans]|uniref:Kinase-like protein n=1 Tax=Ophiobolus disseminans TaxID=1469910 RepID=A0A6A6ZTE2_9PLEO|nr:kinase-like protein [Ophiobolus disseminans]
MGRGNTFLLSEGDELQISETVTLIFSSAKSIQQVEFTPIQEREKAIFSRDYLITGRLLGEGGYGKVLIGIDQATQRQLACKMIRLDHLYDKVAVPNLRLPTGPHEKQTKGGGKRWPTRVAACFREFDILKDLSHPNIVSIEKVFWSNNTIYIFQELVTGGDLFSFLEYKGGRLNNAQAAVVIRQVLIGVKYLHEQGIVHRDLKPDNILMTSLEDGARVVITDFGNARFLPNAACIGTQEIKRYQRMFSYVGTLEFAAPEIHKANRTIPADEGYSKSVDMWSIGSITATVLTGDVIFTDRTHPQYFENPRLVIVGLAAQCDLSVLDDEYHPSWSEVGPFPKDFIRRLLVLEEADRMTATEALAHAWFTNDCYAEDLEDLYARSIREWHSRPMGSQLVERISKSLPDLTAVGLPGRVICPDNVSRFFHPSEQSMTQNIVHALSASQHWRANTPLPSITDDYEEGLQDASQIAPSSYDANSAKNASQCYGDVGGSNQQRQSSNTRKAKQLDEETRSRYDYEYEQTSRPIKAQQNSKNGAEVIGMYSTAYDEEHQESYGSTESLNDVKLVAYSQHPYGLVMRQQQVGTLSEAVLVQGTPVEPDASQDLDESYRQTQFPEEYQHGHVYDDEQDSVLVYETPPGAGSDGIDHHPETPRAARRTDA